jgi:hypothetical protein
MQNGIITSFDQCQLRILHFFFGCPHARPGTGKP